MTARTFRFTVAGSQAPTWVPAPGYYANVPQVNTFESQETDGPDIQGTNFYDAIESYSTTRRAGPSAQFPLGSILAFGGGHGNGGWNGIYRFDLSTLSWSTVFINNGIVQTGRQNFVFDGEWGDATFGEFYADANGTTTHVGEPCARHSYNYTLWLPPGSIGNDPLGYFYLPWGGALTGSGGQHCRGSHYAQLSNPAARWTRFGLWTSSGNYGHALYDSVRKRAVAFPASTSSRTRVMRFHDCATGTMTSVNVTDPLSSSGLRNKDGASFYWAARDLYIHVGGVSAVTTQCIKLIDPNSSTYAVATVTTNPVFTRPAIGAWEWVEEWQQLIYIDSASGVTRNRVHRFTPPSDPLTQPWTYTTVDLQPATVGLAMTIDTGHESGYGKLQYHPPIGAFITTFSGTLPPQVLSIPASSVTLTWTVPTVNVDGSPLTGGDAIARYRVEWGSVIGGAFGYFINSVSVDAPATSVTLTDLPAGEYAFRVTAIAVDGEESDPAFLGTRTVI